MEDDDKGCLAGKQVSPEEWRAEVAGGYALHITTFDDGRTFEVWLNSEAGDFDGLPIGFGETSDAAVAQAVAALEAAVEKLQTRG